MPFWSFSHRCVTGWMLKLERELSFESLPTTLSQVQFQDWILRLERWWIVFLKQHHKCDKALTPQQTTRRGWWCLDSNIRQDLQTCFNKARIRKTNLICLQSKQGWDVCREKGLLNESKERGKRETEWMCEWGRSAGWQPLTVWHLPPL